MNIEQAKQWQAILNSISIDAKLIVDGVIGAKSIELSNAIVKSLCMDRGFSYPENGLIYIRTDQTLSNTFDDFVVRFNNGIIDTIAPCTTTSGDYYIKNPLSKDGTAIALEQQVKNCHKFVTGKSWANLWLGAPYFQQIKPIQIYRDNDKDTVITKLSKFTGLYGINLHRGGSGNLINKWSAACQVTPDSYWFKLIDIFKSGDIIDFTLIDISKQKH